MFTLNATADGYASGSKDGTVGLWDTEFKPIARIDLNKNSIGYSGKMLKLVKKIHQFISSIFIM